MLLWVPECLHWPFCPGVFIAILAFLAAVVAFRDPGRKEKGIWTVVFLGLMSAEVWMMGADRNLNEKKQRTAEQTQLKGFTDIGDGIKKSIETSQQQFAETMAGSNKIFAGVKDNLNAVTGRESFVEFGVVPNMGSGNPQTYSFNGFGLWKIPNEKRHGRTPKDRGGTRPRQCQ